VGRCAASSTTSPPAWTDSSPAPTGAPSYQEFDLVNYVFSATLDFPSTDRIHFVKTDAAATVAELKRQEGRDIWLCGGGALAASLLGAGLIDEVALKVNPIWLGEGIPLFRRTAPVPLRLIEATTYPNGAGLLRYAPG
jgi:dihydrofolate reductase